jgi:AraC family transcriptional regulator, regulatory protein of adaptative response / methylated-DNA-[protein]-cysteine methyltransferase
MKTLAKNTASAAIENTSKDPRWALVQARDKTSDGAFYYSVKTTGVYCKPSCASRVARPENVAFHASCQAAELAGFRPCKRCKPNQENLQETQARMVAESCRMIVEAEQNLSLDTLANKTGLSTFHFHRVFKAMTGLTPKAYALANRAQKLRLQITKKQTVTDAIYEAGYQSSSRFYEQSAQVLGMKPSRYKNGGASTDMVYAVSECSLGAVLVASSAQGICAILLGDSAEKLLSDLVEMFPRAQISAADKNYKTQVAKVIAMIEAPKVALDLPLDIRGTVFQQKVWQALREIPAGKTLSYAQLAERIGKPKAVRAVASACAANKIAVAIPCHRILRNDGSISGYRWGVERKATLLAMEAKAKEKKA